MTDAALLDEHRDNWLLTVHAADDCIDLAALDNTTGRLSVMEFESVERLCAELERFNPAE